MNFQKALTLMQDGYRMTRKAWDDPNIIAMIDEVQGVRTDFQKVVACQVAHYTHAKLGWNPTRNDILATDWEYARQHHLERARESFARGNNLAFKQIKHGIFK